MQDNFSPKKPITLIVTTVVLGIALAGSLVFGYWAFNGRQDYKNNSDKKSTAAVAIAKSAQAKELQAQFNEQYKNPNKTYQSSATYGSISFNYPKTWSAYVDESSSSEPINGYFYPVQVPGAQSGSAFALRVELVTTAYSQVIQGLSGQIKSGKITADAYMPPQMNGVANAQTGTLLEGQILPQQQGTMVVLQVRDKTLKIYTESDNYISDFNNIILVSLKYTP
jgi:hypothetical protein